MIHAYEESYVHDAMCILGEAFEYAQNTCDIALSDFYAMLFVSHVGKQFEKGNPKYVAGRTGAELVLELLSECGLVHHEKKREVFYDYAEAYWCGWILAYYQWYSGMTFKQLSYYITVTDLINLYSSLHEASVHKFTDVMEKRISRQPHRSKLQKYRLLQGYTQKELAEQTGVALRMIQQYEQGAKDIKKASAITVYALANRLHCSMEDLLE